MKTALLFFLYTTASILGSSAARDPRKTTRNHTAVIDKDDPINWPVDKFIKTQKQNMNSLLKSGMPAMMEMSSALTGKCSRDLMMFGNGLRQFKDWSFRMLDSTAKLHSGVLEGTILSMGSYDECVDIVVASEKNPSEEMFRGQYCVLAVRFPNSLLRPYDVVSKESGIKNFNETVFRAISQYAELRKLIKIKTSICLPSTCSEEDVERLATKAVRPLGFSSSVLNCDIKGPLEVSRSQVIICCILLPIAFLVVTGTMTDFFLPCDSNPKIELEKSWKNKAMDTLKEFSVYSNTKKFLKGPNYHGKLDMLAGMRFLSTSWTILGHSYYNPYEDHFFLFNNANNLFESQNDLSFTAILNMSLSMDTFFLITAFLTTYNSLKAMKKDDGKLPAFRFIAKRITRFLPMQFLTIGLLMLMPLFGSGPLWKSTWKPEIENCENFWWTNLLFVQNFRAHYDMCLFHTWYIAVSMQMHVITFFLLILLYRKPVLGICANVGLIVAGCVAIALVTFYGDYSVSFDVDLRAHQANEGFTRNVYSHVYGHIGPYCTGILLSYFVIKYPDIRLRNKTLRIVAWMTATAAALACLYGVFAFREYSWHSQPPFARVFYAGMYRTVFGTCVAWVILDCISYPKGLVNSILSWRPMIFLDTLALLAYLMHPVVIAYHQARSRQRLSSDVIDMIYFYLGNMILTYMMAFLLHVTIERPVNTFDKALFSTSKQNKPDVEAPEKTSS